MRALARLLPRHEDLLRERIEIAGVAMIVIDEPSFGEPAPACQRRDGPIEYGSGRRRTILRIERQHEQTFDVLLGEPLNRARNIGVSIGHCEFDSDTVA